MGFSSILRILSIGMHLLDLTKIKSSPKAANYLLVKKKLCDSIKKRRTVRLRHSDESAFRTFNPYVLYRSPKNKILVSGVQIRNDSGLNKEISPLTIEAAKISEVIVTEDFFEYDIFWRIPENKFANGVICILKP